MKKKLAKLFILFSLFCFLFYSCSRNRDKKENEFQYKLNNYIYDYTVNSFLNTNNFYLPDSLKNLLSTVVIKKGNNVSIFELLYPERINQFNTLNFYTGYEDDCLWIDDLIMDLEEERIAAEILEMENMLSEVEPIVEDSEENEALKAENKINEYIKNEVANVDKSLSYMEYGEEKFIPQILKDKYIFINSYKNDVSRKFYDKLFRCYRVENWKINSTNDNELVSFEDTFFDGDTYIPTERKSEGKNWKKNQIFENGLLKRENNYVIFEDKDYIKSTLTLKYNKDNKISESLLKEYTYSDNNYSKVLYTFDKRYVYKYNKDDIPADFDYYENNILKIRNKYSSNGTYTSRIYFDNDYSVTTFYQDNKPIKEVFAIKDRVERVNNYEQ